MDMTPDEKIQALADLLTQGGKAHHMAYIETNGADPDWAIWYADYLHDKLPAHLNNAQLHKSEIVYLLMHMSFLQPMDAPAASWPRWYARYLLQRYG